MLVGHDVVVADHGKLGDDLLPRHGTPPGNAEPEAATQALPIDSCECALGMEGIDGIDGAEPIDGIDGADPMEGMDGAEGRCAPASSPDGKSAATDVTSSSIS